MSERSSLARRLYEASHVTGSFKLRSGGHSDQYFDKYGFETDPALLREIAAGMVELLPDDVEMLAGLELGGVPLAAVISQQTGLPLLFVRKQAKEYGTCRQVEGAERVDGRRVAIVEDVVTSGGAILDALPPLRAIGADVRAAICVIDREAGAGEALAAEGVPLRSLFPMSAVVEAAAA